MEFREIKKEFTKNDFNFTQLKREGNVALYKKTRKDFSSFETIIIQICNEEVNLGYRTIYPGERYPCSNRWGDYGWTDTNLDDALKRFEKVILKQKNLAEMPQQRQE